MTEHSVASQAADGKDLPWSGTPSAIGKQGDRIWAAPNRKPYLFIFIFASWTASLLWFGPRLIELVLTAEGMFLTFILAYFSLFTTIAWLYGLYNIGVVGFSAIYRSFFHARPSPLVGTTPSVAVLYTTCNDFVESSAQSCVGINYPNFHLYILDDSSSAKYHARIDRFAEQNPQLVTVVRRADRKGFKAGNLNNGLSRYVKEPYFAVVDADERVPPEFLNKLVPYLEADPDCGFVQANHQCETDGATRLQRDMKLGIDVHWKWYQPLRNAFGFVMFLGHGAVLRTNCWREIGGFPEIVSEDLAFAIAIRERGYYGVFAEDVVCTEAFPETVRAFRVRHVKWTRGTCEFLHRWGPRLMRSKNVPLVEKLDIFFPTANLPLTFFYFIFMALVGLSLPLLIGERHTLTAELGGIALQIPIMTFPEQLTRIFTPDFYAITLLTLVSPVLCFIFELWRTPLRLLRFLAHSTALYASLSPLSTICVFGYGVTRRAHFLVTGDSASGLAKEGNKRESTIQSLTRFFSRTHPDFKGVQLFEIVAAITFFAGAVASLQLALVGLAIGFLMLPVLHQVTWDNAIVRYVDLLPAILIALGIALGGMGLFGAQPILFGFGFHF